MQITPIKAGIATMLVIGLIWLVYVFISGTGKSETGTLDSYARGEMGGFVTLADAPAQPAMVYTDPDGGEHLLSDYRGKAMPASPVTIWSVRSAFRCRFSTTAMAARLAVCRPRPTGTVRTRTA